MARYGCEVAFGFYAVIFWIFQYVTVNDKKIPLPEGQELTDGEFEKVNNMLLLLLGASCDTEINSFMSELDEKIVDSVYKLELKRHRKSMVRDNMYNVDMKRLAKRFERETIPGKHMENIFTLIMNVVYGKKGIDYSKMSDEEYDEFLKSAISLRDALNGKEPKKMDKL